MNKCVRPRHRVHPTPLAGGLVVRDGRVLLIFHLYIQEWLQPGGHIDDGESPIDAAIREVYEETGITCKPIEGQLESIHIDLHEIPANPQKGEGAHLHIDLLFLLDGVEEGESSEGIQKAWLTFGEVSNTRLRCVLDQFPH